MRSSSLRRAHSRSFAQSRERGGETRRGVASSKQLLPGVPKDAELTAMIGRIVSGYRRRMNISQERLARSANVDRTYFAKLERGLVNPTLYRLDRVLGMLGVTWRTFGAALDREQAAASENRAAGRARRPPARRAR